MRLNLLTRFGMVPPLYKRHVDDTLARMPTIAYHCLPWQWMVYIRAWSLQWNFPIIKRYRKPTNTGLLSFSKPCRQTLQNRFIEDHVPSRLCTVIFDRSLHEECAKLRSIFSRLDYPIGLINSTIDMFIQNIATKSEKKTDDGNTIRIVLPF